nr:MAG TPA: hypothetical protein [Caudoviricetes sp.]
MTFFKRGRITSLPSIIYKQKEEIKMKHIIIILVVALIVWYSGGDRNEN